MNDTPEPPPPPKKRSFGCLHVLLVVIIILLVAIVGCLVWIKRNIYASSFKPVELSQTEQTLLDGKLERLEAASNPPVTLQQNGAPVPEAYSEKDADREIRITERELNAMIAKDPDMAEHIAIDLSENLISMKVVMPIEDEIPMFGGKTLRLNVGMTMNFESDHPVIALKGISLGGIPLPNAWLGNIKNQNLVKEFGGSDGFWTVFASGVEALKIRDGEFWVKLKE